MDKIPQEVLGTWPKCAVPGCNNKCCISLYSKYCYPHTPGIQKQTKDASQETELNKESAENADLQTSSKTRLLHLQEA